MKSIPARSVYRRISPASSNGRSTTRTPSTPARRARSENRATPYFMNGLKYPKRTSGIERRGLSCSTISRIASSVVPFRSARIEARWMVGPSAVGSEKGTPISMISAPACWTATRSSPVASRLGSPAVRYDYQRPVAVGPYSPERVADSAHLSETSIREAIVLMSLSPLPDRLTMISPFLPIPCAMLIAAATAWALSRAGMIPSSCVSV